MTDLDRDELELRGRLVTALRNAAEAEEDTIALDSVDVELALGCLEDLGKLRESAAPDPHAVQAVRSLVEPSGDPLPRLTLADARDTLREQVIAAIADPRPVDVELGAYRNVSELVSSLEGLERLLAAEGLGEQHPAVRALDELEGLVRELVQAVEAGGVHREHFEGRLEAMVPPLEALSEWVA